jgi:hypothetical protein
LQCLLSPSGETHDFRTRKGAGDVAGSIDIVVPQAFRTSDKRSRNLTTISRRSAGVTSETHRDAATGTTTTTSLAISVVDGDILTRSLKNACDKLTSLSTYGSKATEMALVYGSLTSRFTMTGGGG